MLLQILDCDYIEANGKPVIRLFCKTEAGESVCVFHKGFLPYFYVKASEELEEFLKDRKEILSIEKVKRKRGVGYTSKEIEVYKLTLTSPKLVKKLREELKKLPFVQEIYEADILFVYRFLVDHELGGMRWISCEGRPTITKTVKVKAIEAKSIKPVKREGNAKLRMLALDIECLPKDERSIISEENEIILISMRFSPPYKGKEELTIIARGVKGGENLIAVSSERELLQKFLQILDDYDPDLLIGYNIHGFDLPQIIARLKANKLPTTLGRCNLKPASVKKLNEGKECRIIGRVVVDPYKILKRDPWMRFKRYDLNTVAKQLLGEGKVEIDLSELPKYWNGGQEKLMKLVEYVRKDAELALRLITEKRLLDKFFELAKLSGLLLQDTFGGQSKRVENALLYEFKRRGLLMPCKPDEKEKKRREKEREKHGLKGAIVLEPVKGLHSDGFTIVLDFTSLYPNIIRTYNISPDTLITDEVPEKYIEAPTGARFVSADIYRGVMPAVLDELLEKRIRIKKLAKKASGERKFYLNAVQLALKDMANSMYGYTGYLLARLYVLDVANAITAFGRANLKKVKQMIEEKFGLKVIYADTDSVFLKTKLKSMEEAKQIGERICEYVNSRLPGTLELDFDKLFKSFLILTKKRYAGLACEEVDGKVKYEILTKGIETVRRDWCDLVSETQEKVLDYILRENNVRKAVAYVREVIEKLKRNEVPLEKLTIVKSITKPLDAYEGVLPHIELAKKLARRNPAKAPKVGDRIGFVIIAGNAMLSKRAEDPAYVKENNLQIDWNYYLTNQILPAIERILNAVGVERGALLGEGFQTRIGDTRFLTQKTSEAEKERILDGWECFVCKRCKRSYSRIPLRGVCDCGGELLILYRGSLARACKQKLAS